MFNADSGLFLGGAIVPKQTQFKLEELLVHFDKLEGLRSSINRHHRLASVVVIALFAVLSITAGLFIDDTKHDRVLRGGSFDWHASEVRSTPRRSAAESYRNAVNGFRLVRTYD